MTGELLRQSDIVLSRCGRPVSKHPGLRVVAIPKAFKSWATFAAAPASTISTIQVTITGDTTWMLRSISSYAPIPMALRVQIQFPDGRNLFHDLADIISISGYGSWRYPLSQERACPPGTKIQVTYSDLTPGAPQAVPLLLEGCYYYHVQGSAADARVRLASSLPRYVPGENQNILAPCWAFGEGPQAPQGYRDDPGGGWYDSGPPLPIDVGALTPKNGILTIQIEQGSDFMVRNLFFNVTQDGTVTTANVLVKVRSYSGYAFTNDYVLTNILNGVPQLKDWKVKAGDRIVCDVTLVDNAGTGNVYVQAFASGVKRRRAA